MDFQPFINEYYANPTKRDEVFVARFLNQVNELLIKAKIVCNINDDATAIKFVFNDTKNINILLRKQEGFDGAGQHDSPRFSVCKKICKNFIEYLGNNNLLGNADALKDYVDKKDYLSTLRESNVIALTYFKSLDDALMAVDYAGQTAFSSTKNRDENGDELIYKPENECLAIKSIVILAWYGIAAEDMPAVNKEDIIQENGSFYIKFKDKNIEIQERHYNILVKYANTTSYRGIPYCKIINIIDSPKLFRGRGYLYRDDTRNNKFIANTIKRFNEYAETINLPKRLSTLTINKSGMFNRAYLSVGRNLDKFRKFAMQEFGIHRTNAYSLQILYVEWLRVFL